MGTNYVKKARTVRLPPVTDFQINHFDTGVVDSRGSYLYNTTIFQYPDETYYATQRPSFAVFNAPGDATVPVTDFRGRGVFYWAERDSLYFVNDQVVYKGNYNGDLTPLLTNPGTEKVSIAELGDDLVFVDAQGNEMWYINASADTTLVTMQKYSDSSTDVFFTATKTITTGGAQDFSSLDIGDTISVVTTSGLNDGIYTIATVSSTIITTVETSIEDETAVAAGTTTIESIDRANLPQNDGQQLAHGVAVLDQTMYVLDTQGIVYGSALGNAQDWSDTLNKITAEKEEDAGVYIAKHYDNIAIFGRRTIEFMYGAGNVTGSPLSVRQDISYNIGCADPNSVWRNGDDIYFLGIDTSGQIQPYVLREFQLTPIANTSIISYLTTSKSIDNIKTMGSGMSSGGVTYYVLTVYTLDASGNILPTATYVYNSNTQIWAEWEFAGAMPSFPLIGYTVTDDSRIGEGITSCGCLVYATDNYTPYDASDDASDPYVVEGYVGAGYVFGGTAATSDPIDMIIRLDNFDNDSRDWKFAHQLRFIGDETKDPNTMTIKWNDGSNYSGVNDTYTGTRTIDLNSNLNKLTRLGRFKSRSFEFHYSGTEQIRFKGIDLDITEGTH